MLDGHEVCDIVTSFAIHAPAKKGDLLWQKESFDVFVGSFHGASKKQRVSSQKTGKGYRVPADFW